MKYFCYISAYKVEQYMAQLPIQIGEQISQSQDFEKTHEIEGGLGGLWNLISVGTKYGRSDKVQAQSTYQTHLVEKLLFLLRALGPNQITVLTKAIKAGTTKGYDMFYLSSRMRVKTYDDKIALLEANIDSLVLELSCSIRYFSEYTNTDVPFSVHSGNYHFFKGIVSPLFDAVIIPIEKLEDRLVATPLFLAIDTSAGTIL